jgi:peptidoglycan/xylan/chitin deacetylase (PgdA/CDA1 family)
MEVAMDGHRRVIVCLAAALAAAACSGGSSQASPEQASAATAGCRTAGSGLPVPPGGFVHRPHGRPGNLEVLDWAGFTSAVSWTFDDSQRSQIDHYDALNAEGIPLTFYVNDGAATIAMDTAAAYDAVWTKAAADGHEVASHTTHHCNLDPTATPALSNCAALTADATPFPTAGEEITENVSYIEQHFGVSAVYTFATPYGDDDWNAADLAKKYFFLSRKVGGPFVAPNDATDPYEIPSQMMGTGPYGGGGDQLADFNGFIDQSRTGKSWCIFLVHTIVSADHPSESYTWNFNPVDITVLDGSMEYEKSLGDVWGDTMENIGAYWVGQKVLASAQHDTWGPFQLWRWTLPPNFPPGKYLRVRVSGGTLWQNHRPLAWDPHGYYEISLDAGSLTLTP